MTKPAPKRGRKRKSLKAREYKYLLEVYDEGWTIGEMCEHFYCDESAITDYLDKKGLNIAGEIQEYQERKIQEYQESQLTNTDIMPLAREHILSATDRKGLGLDYQLEKARELCEAYVGQLPTGGVVPVKGKNVQEDSNGFEFSYIVFNENEQIRIPVFPDLATRTKGLKLLNDLSGISDANKFSLLAHAKMIRDLEQEEESKNDTVYEIVFPERDKL